MELHEGGAHSFIVRIWLEETVAEAGRAVWRGHITHVVTGERRYFSELGGITDFIRGYMNRIEG